MLRFLSSGVNYFDIQDVGYVLNYQKSPNYRTPSSSTSKNDQSMPGIHTNDVYYQQPSHFCTENGGLIISWCKIRWFLMIRTCLTIQYLPYKYMYIYMIYINVHVNDSICSQLYFK